MYRDYEATDNYFGKDSLLANRYMKMLSLGKESPEPWFPLIKDLFRWVSNNLIPLISEIQIPIRSINSDQEETKFKEWRFYHNDFDAIIIENSGYYLHWEYPDIFNRSLDDLIQEIIG